MMENQKRALVSILFFSLVLSFVFQDFSPFPQVLPECREEATMMTDISELPSPTVSEVNITNEWNITWGGTSDDWAGYGALDPTGEFFYDAGSTKSFGDPNADAFLVKYAMNKTQMWSRTWGKSNLEYSYDIAINPSTGDIYQTGRTLSFTSADDAFLVKWASNGTEIWNRTWGKPSSAQWDYGTDVVLDTSGNVYICGGTTSQGAGNFDAFIAKFDPDGNQIWNLTWGGTDDESASQMAINASGALFISGYTKSFTVGGWDAYVACFNSGGSLLWSRTWGGPLDDQGIGIGLDGMGNVYLSGDTKSWGTGNFDAFLVKYSSTGEQIWNRTFGGTLDDRWESLAVDSQNNIYTVGFTYSYGHGGNDMLFGSYSPSGSLLWNRTWGGTSDDSGVRIAVNATGHLFLFGTTSSIGAGLQDALITCMNHLHPPMILGQLSTEYAYGTNNHEISWTVTDILASAAATYTIYHNESVLGTPNLSWTNGQVITCNVGGFNMGDHNITLVAQDGFGFTSQNMTLVSVIHAPLISGANLVNARFGDSNLKLTWHIIDNITNSPTFTVFHNGSIWGTPNLPWVNDTDVSINVEGLQGGYHNFTINATDGLGLSSLSTTILVIHRVPLITCPEDKVYTYNTVNNNISWTILDNTTTAPTFKIFKNGTAWGPQNQGWKHNESLTINVDGLSVGHYNITIEASDGFGDFVIDTVLLTVIYALTNGTWQTVLVGPQVINCAQDLTKFAELYVEGLSTGSQIKITAQFDNPLSEPLQNGITYYSITLDPANKVKFPVVAKFFFKPENLPSGIKPADLGVYHFENGAWVYLGGYLDIESNSLSVNCQSFSVYAIGVKPNSPPFPIDPALLAWLVAIAAMVILTSACVRSRKKKVKNEADLFPDIDFD